MLTLEQIQQKIQNNEEMIISLKRGYGTTQSRTCIAFLEAEILTLYDQALEILTPYVK